MSKKMSDETILEKLALISRKIDYIFTICGNDIIKALEEELKDRPAIFMHLSFCCEEFKKLKEAGYDINPFIDKTDFKGFIDTRNFVVHDYEGVNLYIIEKIVKYNLPQIKERIDNYLATMNQTQDTSKEHKPHKRRK